MKVGDLVRYSREAPSFVWGMVGIVTETRIESDRGFKQARICWTDARYNKSTRWYFAECIERINESR